VCVVCARLCVSGGCVCKCVLCVRAFLYECDAYVCGVLRVFVCECGVYVLRVCVCVVCICVCVVCVCCVCMCVCLCNKQ
jgi:hypothetical protein